MTSFLVDDLATSRYFPTSIFAATRQLGVSKGEVKTAHLIWDIQQDVWEYGAQLFELFGVDPQHFAVSESALLGIKHPDDLLQSQEQVNSVRGGTPNTSYSHRIFRTDGFVRTINSAAEITTDSNGLPCTMSATIDALSAWHLPLNDGDIASASDGELMLGIRARMPDAFSEIFGRYNSQIAGIARQYLTSSQLVDDVVQDVFESILNFPSRYDARRGSLGVFVRMQARSRSIDLQRSHSRSHQREFEHGSRDSAFAAEDEVFGRISTDSVRLALATLTPSVRKSIQLAFVDGFSYREVADYMGVPDGTAKARIRRGLQQLRNSGCLGLNDGNAI